MVNQLALVFSYAALVVMIGAVVATVDRDERYMFALGIVLLLLGLAVASQITQMGLLIALAGFVAIGASVAPLVYESATA